MCVCAADTANSNNIENVEKSMENTKIDIDCCRKRVGKHRNGYRDSVKSWEIPKKDIENMKLTLKWAPKNPKRALY